MIRELPVLTNFDEAETFKVFPYAIILTQACDIISHYKVIAKLNQDSVEVNRQFISNLFLCPAFDEEKFKTGEHLLDQYNVKLKNLEEDVWTHIKKNKDIRFQYLQSNDVDIPNLIIDFKHFFTVKFSFIELFLQKSEKNKFILEYPHLLNLTDRFAHYIQRVAIP